VKVRFNSGASMYPLHLLNPFTSTAV
jgi:hypothetical protein